MSALDEKIRFRQLSNGQKRPAWRLINAQKPVSERVAEILEQTHSLMGARTFSAGLVGEAQEHVLGSE